MNGEAFRAFWVITNNAISLIPYFPYSNQTCPVGKPDFSNINSPRSDSSSSKTFEKLSQIGAKAGVSTARVIISFSATKRLYKEVLDTSATKKLGVGQFFSSIARQRVNKVTDDPAIRTIAHTTTQTLRNVYRGTSSLEGAIDSAGYCITNEVVERFKNNGEKTKSSLLTSIAGTYTLVLIHWYLYTGTYTTEMTEPFASCMLATTVPGLNNARNTATNSFICAASLGKSPVTATFVSALMIYGYFKQDPNSSLSTDIL